MIRTRFRRRRFRVDLLPQERHRLFEGIEDAVGLVARRACRWRRGGPAGSAVDLTGFGA
jgi:hypothetical protein